MYVFFIWNSIADMSKNKKRNTKLIYILHNTKYFDRIFLIK